MTVTFTSLVAMFAFPSVAVMVTSYTLSLSASAGFSKSGASSNLSSVILSLTRSRMKVELATVGAPDPKGNHR